MMAQWFRVCLLLFQRIWVQLSVAAQWLIIVCNSRSWGFHAFDLLDLVGAHPHVYTQKVSSILLAYCEATFFGFL